jgi:hypothetical protein
MSEQNLLKRIQLKLSPSAIMFRNNTGMGWIGKSFRASKPTKVNLLPGDVVIRQARPLHAGLCKGSSDLIGWSVKDGHAIFTAIEAKTGNLKVTNEQRIFLENVRKNGGIAFVSRDADESVEILKKQLNEL